MKFLRWLIADAPNGARGILGFVIVVTTIFGFIAGIFWIAAATRGPYHPGPKQVCLRAHDVYHTDNEDDTFSHKVCDDYGVVYPGGLTPSPNPASSAVEVK